MKDEDIELQEAEKWWASLQNDQKIQLWVMDKPWNN